LWTLSVLLGGAALGLSAPVALQARQEESAQAAQLAQVRVLTERLAERQHQATYRPPSDDSRASLPERLAEAVAAAGLGKGVLVSVHPGPQEQARPVVRQGASVALANLTLPELGRLLERWRALAPAWVVTGIDLSPEAKSKAEPGADLPLRAGLSLERLVSGDEP
jgi:hypothetical protein